MPIPFSSRKKLINHFLTSAFVMALVAGATLVATGQTTEGNSEKKGDQQPSIKLHVAGNLVVVRVVVRDARGEPVQKLRKEDFKVYDNGKEQSIAQFEAKVTANASNQSLTTSGDPSVVEPSQSPAIPNAFFGTVL